MWIVMEKDRCPLCGFFGSKTGEKNIFVCPRCSLPFSEFGLPEKAMIQELEEADFHRMLN